MRGARVLGRILGILFVFAALAFVGWEYYSSAWLRSRSSATDHLCFSQLRNVAEKTRSFRREHGRTLADPEKLACEPSLIRCPGPPHTPYVLLPDGSAVCTNHRESRPGWDLRYDRAAFVVGPSGYLRIIEADRVKDLLKDRSTTEEDKAQE